MIDIILKRIYNVNVIITKGKNNGNLCISRHT